MKTRLRLTALTLLAFVSEGALAQAPRFEVTVSPSAHGRPLTGRLVVVVSKTETPEPRYTISPSGSAIFAIDLEQLPAGQPAVIDQRALGYPTSLAELPPGTYYAQAVINVYEQVKRSDGHSIWVRMNDGSQEVFQLAPGNLYSDPQRVTIGAGGTVRLSVA